VSEQAVDSGLPDRSPGGISLFERIPLEVLLIAASGTEDGNEDTDEVPGGKGDEEIGEDPARDWKE
jgi:hypothetical protein